MAESPHRYNPPPGWPTPPPGWIPPAGWVPDASWPPAPPGWVFWLPNEAAATAVPGKTSTVMAIRVAFGILLALWLVGFAVGGWASFLIGLGVAGLVVGFVAIARGRLLWAWLPNRKGAVAVMAAALVCVILGGAFASSTPSPPTDAVATQETPAAATPTPTVSTPTPTPTVATVSPTPSITVASPSPTPTTSPLPTAKPGTALAAAATLVVRGRAPMTGYTRAEFGPAWTDVNRNGCDTRNDILRRDLAPVTVRAGTNGCLVVAGTLTDAYTGAAITFTRGVETSMAVQIDHVVALGDAWQKGAQAWTTVKRTAFANDPLNLLAVKGSVNASKGDGDTATWLPPNKAIRCAYVARQVTVKANYGLWTTAAERTAMERVLSGCPTQRLISASQAVDRKASSARVAAAPTPKAKPSPKPTPRPQPKPKPSPKPSPKPPPPAHSFENCTDMHTVYPHGVGLPGAHDQTKSGAPVTNFHVSAALYNANSGSDSDDDGVACESR